MTKAGSSSVKLTADEVLINGKRVIFRPDKITVKEARKLWPLVEKVGTGDWEANIPALQKVIQEWEFEGSPADAAAYEGLDFFREMVPLIKAFNDYLMRQGLGEGTTKN